MKKRRQNFGTVSFAIAALAIAIGSGLTNLRIEENASLGTPQVPSDTQVPALPSPKSIENKSIDFQSSDRYATQAVWVEESPSQETITENTTESIYERADSSIPSNLATSYASANLRANFLERLPEPESGVALGSEEHIAQAREFRVSQYIQNTIGGTVETSQNESSTNKPAAPQRENPYFALKESGGVFAMIPPEVGQNAETEAELLQEYRQHKMELYISRAEK